MVESTKLFTIVVKVGDGLNCKNFIYMSRGLYYKTFYGRNLRIFVISLSVLLNCFTATIVKMIILLDWTNTLVFYIAEVITGKKVL
jgi:hypothetical protein